MADVKICKIDGCGKSARTRGWCPAHYERWRRKGDPLSGGDVKTQGDALSWLRINASHDGDDCLDWPFAQMSNGYGAIRFQGRSHPAHRVMCIVAHGKPEPKMHALHSCGNGHLGCVNPRHLRWGTAQENMGDRRDHGTASRKLSHDDVRAIRLDKRPPSVVASEHGVSSTLITNIRNRKVWAGLE